MENELNKTKEVSVKSLIMFINFAILLLMFALSLIDGKDESIKAVLVLAVVIIVANLISILVFVFRNDRWIYKINIVWMIVFILSTPICCVLWFLNNFTKIGG
jgi:hypothetical protein